MNEIFITMARDWFATFKGHMQERKMKGYNPVALLIAPGNELMIVMDWKTLEEQKIVLEKLVAAIREMECIAVILFGTAYTQYPDMGTEPVPFLFANIHTPDEPIYTIGQTYSVLEGETIFGEEIDSLTHDVTPWQVPAFWEKTDG
jgi:hypothetical protein